MARDRGLNRYLDATQKNLAAVEEGFSAVEQSAKNLRARRGDIQRFSEAARSMEVPELPEFGGNPHNPLDPEEVRRFSEEFKRVVQKMAPDFRRVREMAGKMGESTLREFDKVFGRIRDEAEDTVEGFEDLIKEIGRIPGVTPSLVRSIKSIEERFASKRITVAEVAEELRSLEGEIRKAVDAAEPFRRAMRKMEQALKTPEERAKESVERFDEWSEAVSGLFEPMTEADIKKMFGTAIVGTTKLLVASFKAIFRWAKKAGPVGKHFAGKGFFEYLFGKKRERESVKKDLYETAQFFIEEGRRAPPEGALLPTEEAVPPKETAERMALLSEKAKDTAGQMELLSKVAVKAAEHIEFLSKKEERMESLSKKVGETTRQIELLSEGSGKAAHRIGGFAEDFEKAAERVRKADPSKDVGESFQKLAEAVERRADAIEGTLGGISGSFALARRISVGQMKELSEKVQASALALRTRIAEDVGQIRTAVDGAFDSAQGRIEKFGEFIETFSVQRLRRNVGEFEAQFLRGMEVFPLMKEEATKTFEDILSSKKVLVFSIGDNFRKLAYRVGDDIERMSTNVRQEFNEMERGTQAAFNRMSRRLQRVADYTGKMSVAFTRLSARLEKITPSIVKNFEAIGEAAKKASGQNPGLLAAIGRLGLAAIGRLGPALGRAGAAAGRAAPRLARAPRKMPFRERLRERLMREAEERLSEEAEERIESMLERIRRPRRPRREEEEEGEEKKGGRTLGNPEPVPSIVDAINAMSTKLSGQMSKLQQAVRPAGAARPEIKGTLEVESDELMRAFNVSVETRRGLRGMVR